MSINVHVIRCDGPPTVAPTLEGQHWINTITGQMWFANGTATVANWVLLESDTDIKVKVSVNDTTPGYLDGELLIANGTNTTDPLEKFIANPAADEKLTIRFDQSKLSIASSQITDLTENVQDIIGTSVIDTASVDFTYNDALNQISAVVLPGGVDHNLLFNFVSNKHIDHSTVSLIAGTGISATGLGDITASRTINLANTAVTAASYGSATQVPSYTVNAQGQLTAAANILIAIPSTQVTDFSESVDDRVAALLVAGTAITLTYNDPLNTLTIASTAPALTSSAPVNVTKSAAVVGIATDVARADHKHDITTAIAVDVGATDAEGTSTALSRADHVHQGVRSVKALAGGTQRFGDVILEQGTNITIVDVAGTMTVNATAQAGTGLKNKTGTVAAGSFAGTPKKFTVTFGTPFASTAYAINITGTDSRSFTWESKLAGSFVINTNAFAALTGNVDWQAVVIGESN